MGSAAVTLYAQWTLIPTYSVTYNSNSNTGGSVPTDGATYANGATVTVLGNTGTLVRTGYTFNGWNTAANGSGTARTAASTFTMGSAAVTLYAQWTVAVVNGNCGSPAPSAFAPNANLCLSGSVSAVVLSGGRWNWSCAGSNSGSNGSCSSSLQNVSTGTGNATATVATTNNWVIDGARSAGFIKVTGDPSGKSPLVGPPEGVKLPYGLFDFTLNTDKPGTAASMTINYPTALPANTVYWKFGKTPGDPTPHWYVFSGAVFNAERTSVTLTIVDGGEGDDDLSANGVISDPGGPGVYVDPNDTDGDGFPDNLEAANGLSVGVKDNDVFSNTKFFVMQLYRDVLYREPEAGGLAFWQKQLDTAVLTRAQVVKEVLYSPESQARGGAVVRMYLGALKRLPTVAELKQHALALQGTSTLEQIGMALIVGTDFTKAYGALSNAALIDQLYRNVRGSSDDAGRAFWLAHLDAGMSRGEVLIGFTESAEFKAIKKIDVIVAMDYLGLLGRTPEQAGFDWWVEQQNTNIPEVQVIGGFIVSAEYHGRFLP